MKIDLTKILREIEDRQESDRLSMQEKLAMLKKEARNVAIHSRRRMDQAIKTYAKQGLIEGMHKLYPNQPNMRMKFANDWEGDYSPHGVPGIGSEYGLASISFSPELGEGGEPYPIPGHDGLCRRFHASCHACAGDRRFGEASASTTQTLIFRHDPPPAMGEDAVSWTCGYTDVWVPMTITGVSSALKSDAIFLTPSLGLMESGARAEIRLTIRVEQDTIGSPHDFLIYDGTIWLDEQIGALWLLGYSVRGPLQHPGLWTQADRSQDRRTVQGASYAQASRFRRPRSAGGGYALVLRQCGTSSCRSGNRPCQSWLRGRNS